MQVVSYGMGTNSTAMIIEMWRRGEPIDVITAADTGGERPETYAYLKLFNEWCISKGLPEIVVVKATYQGEIETLEQNCLRMKSLPSVAFGFKTCSQKYKIAPQDKFYNNYQPAKDEWSAGRVITKCVGFDAGEPQRAKPFEDAKFINRYPLIEWDMDRDGCVASILSEGLPLPGKSSCFYCPNSRPHEINALPDELKDRAIALERAADRAMVVGLGRTWRWEDLIRSDRDQIKMFPELDNEMPCGCYDG